VVANDIPPFTIAGGAPAKIFQSPNPNPKPDLRQGALPPAVLVYDLLKSAAKGNDDQEFLRGCGEVPQDKSILQKRINFFRWSAEET